MPDVNLLLLNKDVMLMAKSSAKRGYLIERLLAENWFESEKEALPWLLAGKVLVNDQAVLSGKQKVPMDGTIRIKEYYKKKYCNFVKNLIS